MSLAKNKKNKEKSAKRVKGAVFRPELKNMIMVTKLRRSEKFLHQGNKLKITLMFRGREMEHIDVGMNVVRQALEDLRRCRDDEPKPMAGLSLLVYLLFPSISMC